MKDIEYWRINLAVEKVIARHEFEMLQEKLSDEVNNNPFMVFYSIGQFAAFVASVSARINKIHQAGDVQSC